MSHQIVTVFGGSGFLGRAIVARLARAGFTVRVATRCPQACYALKTLGTPGQIVPQLYHPGRPETSAAAINGAYAVVNTVGILYERRRSTFHAAHVELARQIATACKRYNVARFVHLSALGIDQAQSKYAKTKLQGEQVVQDIFPQVAILRPSILFGPDDHFFNRFARMASILPALPLIGGGNTRFQPVFAGDVADAVQALVIGGDALQGQIYELGGPEVLTFRQIYERLFANTGVTRTLVTLPWWVARVQATFLQMLPHPVLTRDQVKSLETDNVVTPGSAGFRELDIVPKALDTILPTYLNAYRPGGKFAEMKRA